MCNQNLVWTTLLALLLGCDGSRARTSDGVADLFSTQSTVQSPSSIDVWQAATESRSFTFPDDHAAHPDYRVEWWYYTGHLESEDGRRFGYQLTFFRTGLHQQPKNPSKWAVRDLYTAHFALSDVSNARHYCHQRNSRQGIGQAGAKVDVYEVWNGDWRASLEKGFHRLQAADGSMGIDLQLTESKPPVLHGDGGLSRKGPSAGNASHYYSITRMVTSGTIRLGNDSYRVTGLSWMDHEFSTSFLEPGQIGWDWFSIQLDDEVELMVYRMRRDDGTADPFSSGSFIRADGQLSHLSKDDYELTPVKSWISEATGAEYPLSWHLRIPSLGYELDVEPVFESQEMMTDDTTGISYWEGAVDVSGSRERTSVRGHGYVELTGYVGQGLGSLFE